MDGRVIGKNIRGIRDIRGQTSAESAGAMYLNRRLNFALVTGLFLAILRHFMKRLSLSVIALILAAAAPATLWALHPSNAGPEKVEIKFKLPPPAPLSPGDELATMKVAPGFHVELVASEPMIECPVAMSWDEKGRLFVLEMRGYMHDVDGKGEDQPICRVSVLEDTDGDGKMDMSTVFVDGLVMARAVMCVNGGALVAEPPALWFLKDTDGDGKADLKELVDGAFGSRQGQAEHMANSPTWFLDNRIYCANHGARYRLKDGKWITDAVSSRGQWGLSQDDYGRPFYNYSGDFLSANFVPESLNKRNPNFPGGTGVGVSVLQDQTCWPSHPTPGVNRGYDPKQLRDDGTLAWATATCGASVYRGALFPPDYMGNVFIPEPAGNLVKRVCIIEKDGALVAGNVHDKTEFLTSTDERFRPVNTYTGPDGALYIADMYRGVIQHKAFLTHYLIANIKDRQLEQPFNMGRIWRIVPDGAKPAAVSLPAEPAKLVTFLNHANGWVRDTAQRLLVEKKDDAIVPDLAALVKGGSPLAKIHALWTLDGMAALTPDITAIALKDSDPKVRATAVRLADRTLAAELSKLASDPSVDVQIALGFTASAFPEAQDATLNLARAAGKNLLVRDAILSGLRGRELEILEALVTTGDKTAPAEILSALANAVLNERRAARVKKLLILIAAQPAGSAARIAMLQGASGKNAPKGSPKVKLLYLEAEAPELAKLAANADAKTKPFIAALDARIAWPGKRGVPPPPVVIPLTAAEQQLFDTGKQVYSTLCIACHQANGQGMDSLAPALADSDWVLGKADALPRIVLHGLAGPIKVNGRTWAFEMPPLGAALSDEQIAGVLTYIRREWEHNASPISIETVKAIRAEHKDRTKAWTAEELAVPSAKK